MMTGWGILAALALSVGGTTMSAGDTIDGYDDLTEEYRLVEIDGTAFEAEAVIAFAQGGMIRGQGPCNAFGAPQTGEWPAFNVDFIRGTKMACPDLAAEQAFFDALTRMERAASDGSRLTLSNASGETMVFEPQPD